MNRGKYNFIFLFISVDRRTIATLHFMAKLLETIYENIAAQIGRTAKARSERARDLFNDSFLTFLLIQ
jgi:hypothetical protein